MKAEKEIVFPKDFLWGSATSSYQVEGGIENCDWAKTFPADKACNHWQRFEEDFNLLKELNQNAYRFSLEWSRIEPEQGKFSQEAISRYRQMLVSLKKRGIKTMLTLWHFTTPLWLANQGGWANKKAVFYFSRFAQKAFEELGDLVDLWITINEPLVYAHLSYLQGRWPPKKKSFFLFLKVIYNQAKAHKKTYQLLHQRQDKIKIGIAKNNSFVEPFCRWCPFDRFSAIAADYFNNRFFLNKIKNHLDFIGLNYYFHTKIKFPAQIKNENKVTTSMGWEVYPQGIYHVLMGLKRYHLPVYITENGLADEKDALREAFIKRHLYWIWRALEEGVNVGGYFHWSLIDNFEWDHGFGPRFGLIEIKRKTLERKKRPSALSYAKICKENRLKP